MIRFQVLGSVGLRDDGDRDFSALLAQPKRLALLTYLAVARPQGFHHREVLLSLLWPQSGRVAARNALRQALHYLRHSLGDGVIVNRGDHEIAIDPAALWCDGAEFRISLEDRDQSAALDLYRGDLMPGMSVGDAPEFNRWLEEEREHLRERVCSALESAAGAAERSGDLASAVRIRRRSAALEPLSARVALSLIHTLAKAGDRAAAIQHGSVFVRTMRQELGVTNDDGVSTLCEELRGELSEINAGKKEFDRTVVKELAPTKQATVLRVVVLPFALHGDKEYEYLQQGMADLLSRSLDGAEKLRVVDPYAVTGVTNQSGSGTVTPTVGHQVAERFAAQLFILGSIVCVEGGLQAFVTLYDVTRGRLVTAEARGASEAALFEMVEDITRQLLLGRLSPAQKLTRIAAPLTPSISALKAYLTGESQYRRGCFGPARESLERAIAEDGSFALAWYRLGHVVLWLQQPELALEFAERALVFGERLQAHDCALLEAFIALLQGHTRDAERRYHEILFGHPDNVEASLCLGLLLITFNPLRGRPVTEALLPLAHVLDLDPENGAAIMHSAYVDAKEGKQVEHRSKVRKWDDNSEFLIYPRAMHALSRGTPDEGEAVLAELAKASDGTVSEAARYVARLTSNPSGAQRVARLLTSPSRSLAANTHGFILTAQLAAASGRHREAFDAIKAVSRLDAVTARLHHGWLAALPFLNVQLTGVEVFCEILENSNSSNECPSEAKPFNPLHEGLHEALGLYVAGHMRATAGQYAAAMTAADRLAALALGNPSSIPDDWSRGVRADVAWREGRPGDALALLEGARLELSYAQRIAPSPFLSHTLERYLRAQLLEAVDRDEDALRWYESACSDFVHEVVFLAPSCLRRARIHEKRGEYGQARDFYQKFIALWQAAEPEQSIAVEDAQRRLIRLGGRPIRPAYDRHAARQLP